eukprot:ANDGO_05481.mRNA.1 Sodium/potassium-transporting ATPase subunit alpha
MASASAPTMRTTVPVAFEEMRQSLDIEGRTAILNRMQWKFGSIDTSASSSNGRIDGPSKPSASGSGARVTAQPKDIFEHTMTVEQISKLFVVGVDPDDVAQSDGLTEDVAAQRLTQFGRNALTPPKKQPLVLQFLGHCTDLFSIMLLAAGILSFVLLSLDPSALVNVWLGVVLFIVVFINACIGFVQERKSSKIMDQFQNMLPQECTLVRAPKGEHKGSASDLVPGDLVHIKEGEKIPADLRIVKTMMSFKVDNASLTGEAEPQERNSAKATAENPLEASNLVFYGTYVASGEAYGVVIRTGDGTVIGQLARITSAEEKQQSTLSVEINRFVKRMGIVAVISAIAVFVYAVAYGFPILSSFIIAIGMVVAWVPQGLPATVTMLLAIAAKKMAEKKVLVKDLQAVETLGSITCLASDKTGTLTQNKMTVTNLWINRNHYFVSSSVIGPAKSAYFDEIEPPMVELEFEEDGVADRIRRFPGIQSVQNSDTLLRSCLICSRAQFDPSESANESRSIPLQDRKVLGDATEIGLFRFAIEFYGTYSGPLRRVFEIPFHSERKWQLAVFRSVIEQPKVVEHAQTRSHQKEQFSNEAPILLIKGAPERIWDMCSTYMVDDVCVPIDKEAGQMFMKAYEQIAARGLRVLGFAQIRLESPEYLDPAFEYRSDPPNIPLSNMTFIGLCGLMDPPKPGVKKAVLEAVGAGIKVMMVTGDHPITAQAIALDVGILRHPVTTIDVLRQTPISESLIEKGIVLHGSVIPQLTDRDWFQVLQCKDVVFARTSPKQKLEIVLRSQLHGHVVGVTGDGVNDSPALKRADLGISMGISGSDVSKEAAAMILMDDDFCSVLVGIRAGRLIFENLKKSIAYTLTHIIVEVIPILLNLFLQFPIPILPLCILVVDLGTELFPAATFAYEDEESNLLALEPRVSVLPCGPDSARRSLQDKGEKTPQSKIAMDMESQLQRSPSLGAGDIVDAKPTIVSQVRDEHEKRERLIDVPLVIYSYIFMGLLETCGCVLSYFLVFYVDAGITPSDLFRSGGKYFSTTTTDDFVTNSGSHRYTPSEQLSILANAQSAYFIGLVLLQIIHLFLSKTRRSTLRLPHILQKRNAMSMCCSAAICVAIVYIPVCNWIVGTGPVGGMAWVYPLPFGVLMILADTFRKICIRKGWKKSYFFY